MTFLILKPVQLIEIKAVDGLGEPDAADLREIIRSRPFPA